MKKTQIRLFSAVLVGLTASIAAAEPAVPANAVVWRSSAKSFEPKQLEVLSRMPGAGADFIGARLLEALPRVATGMTGSFTRSFEGDRLRAEGRDWSLEVSDDGNRFEYQRSALTTRTLPLALKPSRADVERQGRLVLKSLQEFVSLANDEELVFMRTQYGYSGGQRTDTDKPEPVEVVGWAAVFGRKVAGELVLGGGSMVVVFFNADGTLESINGDWPRYEHTKTSVAVLQNNELLRRAASLVGAHATSGAKTTASGLECGYFDPGGKGRAKQTLLQPACSQRLDSIASTGERRADIRVVPAARRPFKALAWAELAKTCQTEACDEAPTSLLGIGPAPKLLTK
jgi:hypothetical protein